MDISSQNSELFPDQPKKLPGGLNALTILTIIGCIIVYLTTIWSMLSMGDYDSQMEKLEQARDKAPAGFFRNMLESNIDIFQKTYQYRYILFASAILFTTLCFIGALQMRKLKKTGYTLYIIGEIAPVLITGILIGFAGINFIASTVIAILFVALYSVQRKHLVN